MPTLTHRSTRFGATGAGTETMDISERACTPVLREIEVPDRRFVVLASDTLEAFLGHWPRSDRMGDAACHIFQCADLIEVWLETVGKARRTQPVFVGVYDALGHPMLLLGLGIERKWGVRILSFLDGTVCDYNQPIVFPPAKVIDEAAWSRIWPAVIKAVPPFHVAVFDKMPELVGDFFNPLLHLGGASSVDAGHAMALSGSRADVESRLPHQRGRGRLLRRLSAVGPVDLKIARTAADADALLWAVIANKTRQYERTRVPGFETPGTRDLYHAATRLMRRPETVHVSALTVGDAIVACHWGLILDGRFYLLLTAYDEDWKRFSPGALLHEALIRWCHVRGMSWFDFGIGDEAYKASYCDTQIPLYRVEVPLGRIGRTSLALDRIVAELRATRAWRRLRPIKWLIIRWFQTRRRRAPWTFL